MTAREGAPTEAPTDESAEAPNDALTAAPPDGCADMGTDGGAANGADVRDGKAPAGVAPWMAGGALFPGAKKGDGVRALVAGEFWRRLTAKCLVVAVKPDVRAWFGPELLGEARSNGGDIAVHSARSWAERHAADAGLRAPAGLFLSFAHYNAANQTTARSDGTGLLRDWGSYRNTIHLGMGAGMSRK